jgi:hypothetical protein
MPCECPFDATARTTDTRDDARRRNNDRTDLQLDDLQIHFVEEFVRAAEAVEEGHLTARSEQIRNMLEEPAQVCKPKAELEHDFGCAAIIATP